MVQKVNSNYRWPTGGSLELYSWCIYCSHRAQLMSGVLLNSHALTLFFPKNMSLYGTLSSLTPTTKALGSTTAGC